MKVPKNPSNAHYHLRMDCLLAADPTFDPYSLVLPDEIKDKLAPKHKEFLFAFGFHDV